MKKRTLLFALSSILCLCACVVAKQEGYRQESYSRDYTEEVCPRGWVETVNTGIGDATICCPVGTIGVDGYCVDEPISFETRPEAMPEPQNIVTEAVAPKTITVAKSKDEGLVLLSAPNGKGSAYCPERSNSLAWDGTQFKCCGNGVKSVAVPSRDDSICCPETSTSARWVGKRWNDYECCPEGTVEVKNQGEGGKYACCPKGQKAINGECVWLR